MVYEYEKYDGIDVFLGHELIKKIKRHGIFKMFLKYGRIRTLPRFFHIQNLSSSLIYVRKVDYSCVDTLLGKETWKMVWGIMVLMRGVQCGIL